RPAVDFVHLKVRKFPIQFLQNGLGIPYQGNGSLFEGVEFGDIDVYEPEIGVLEARFGNGGKITVPGTDSDDQIGFPGHLNGPWGSRHPNGPQVLGMIVGQGPLSSKGLGNRDSGPTDKFTQDFTGLGIDGPSPSYDYGPGTVFNGFYRPGQQATVRKGSPNGPGFFLKEFHRKIMGLGLYILWDT